MNELDPTGWLQRDPQPLPESFGVLWERFWKFRVRRGERRLPALVRSFFDARALS